MRQRGVTLVELVVAIAVIAISVTATLALVAGSAARSGDAMVQQQAIAIAAAYVEAVSLRPVEDPDGVDAETDRTDYDDLDDFDGLVDVGVRDALGDPVPALSAYTVRVGVADSTALAGVAPGSLHRIDVTVSHELVPDVVVTRYRVGL
jgi:MSHA pilin protein MshD